MTAAMRAPRPLTLVLVAANVVVAALALRPLLPPATRAGDRPAAFGTGGTEPAPVRLAAFADYAATVNRPLFSPSRRPPPRGAASTLGGIGGRYRLVGVVIAGTTRHALIVETATGHSFELGEGQAIAGRVVKRITSNSVVLTSPAGDTTLTLDRAAAPPAATR